MTEVAGSLVETKSTRQEILASHPLDNDEIAELKAAIERYLDFDHRDVTIDRLTTRQQGSWNHTADHGIFIET